MKVMDSYKDGVFEGWVIICPACDAGHLLPKERFTFDGDVDKPTFRPMLLIPGNSVRHTCRSDIREGKLFYFDDCTHPFRGMSLKLGDIVGADENNKE